MKKCSNCFQVKDEADFYRKLTGRQSRCKACNAEVVQSYYRMKADRNRRARWDLVYGRKKQA